MRSRLILPLVLLLSGCTMDRPGTPAPAPAKPTAGAKHKLAAIPFQNDQFFRIVEMGMRDAADRHGVELQVGNSGGSLDKEIQLVDTYVAGRVDAVVIAPTSRKASIPALERAHKAGVKVVTYGTTIDADFQASDIASDEAALGRSTGEEAVRYVQEKRGGKAKVAIVSFLAQLPEQASERNRGFEGAITKLPGVQVVARQDAWLADKAISVVDGILSAHPDVDLIWAANEGGTVGAVTAIRNAGKAGKIAVFGTDISDQLCGFLLSDDDVLQAVTGQKPFQIGSQAIDLAVKALNGQKLEKKVRLPGQLFTRRQPDEVKKYQEYLRGIAK